ncbi:dioxygenase [Desulfovibrio subterraneus]|uniref:DODA-type extradiol aromatic ring-opening family dioxygenase n=1 Tax=Desulfovibrio subterraneus TaxID=2718620 RepID=UPI0022B8F045|nr:class III extradiol ring-cleavage dioxygenase [Desulfovibrio subterraneus]WBF66098.1 dioxygenase [Desulfovibrio subterraneus]
MAKTDAATGNRVLYLSHGAGPMPLLGDAGHAQMLATLQQVAAAMPRPKSIVLMSAHWEEAAPTVTTGTSLPLIYDYYGFPEESYEIAYPAPGAPGLAKACHALLAAEGLSPVADAARGYDHGMFVPLKIMYPEADIPCIQISLVKGLDAGVHLRMGQALAGLADEGVLFVGSGFSFHNMRAFFMQDTPATRAMNEGFDAWLTETCSGGNLAPEERLLRLAGWEEAPHARYCHPREEHLLPLHVCCGIAGGAKATPFSLELLGKKTSMFLW